MLNVLKDKLKVFITERVSTYGFNISFMCVQFHDTKVNFDNNEYMICQYASV